ncbi:hypothetical protein TcasGA2_TC013577 [Tribolium castaneum]|uniref:Uncharacterized protein n=1 Tax=Tribolium castaneum TaxID=7070 RepID=D6W769_TRICA|nr:hypothetical protein TcasGA2_TC013577 [Tribolium castaneum]
MRRSRLSFRIMAALAFICSEGAHAILVMSERSVVIIGNYQEQLQQQHQHRQQGLGRSGAPWPGWGPFWGPPDWDPAEAGGPPLEFGGVERLALLDPRSRQPAPAGAPAPVAGPPPGPALFSVTRSVTLQDICKQTQA